MDAAEWTLTIIVVIAYLLFPATIVFFYLKRTCGKNAQKVDEQVDHPINVWGIRITILFVIAAMVLTAIFPDTFTFSWKDDVFKNSKNRSTWSLVMLIIGAIILYIADFLLIWTLYNLGRMWTMLVSKVNDAQLVTSGPYQLARHPMYCSVIIYFIGYLIISGGWLVEIMFIFHFAFVITRIRNEERVLIQQFGSQYIEYMNQRGAFCPCTQCDCGISYQERSAVLL